MLLLLLLLLLLVLLLLQLLLLPLLLNKLPQGLFYFNLFPELSGTQRIFSGTNKAQMIFERERGIPKEDICRILRISKNIKGFILFYLFSLKITPSGADPGGREGAEPSHNL